MSRWNRPQLLRRLSYGAILLLLHALQNTEGLFPAPFQIHALLLIPGVVFIAMCEREVSGLFYGLFAGLLWDTLAPGANWNAVYLTIIGFLCGAMARYLMRNNIMTASLLSAVALFLYTVLRWFFDIALLHSGGAFRFLFRFYLPMFLYSLLISPLLYYLIRTIPQAFQKRLPAKDTQ